MFDNLSGAKIASKHLAERFKFTRSFAREAAARAAGYRDWHHLERAIGTSDAPGDPKDTPEALIVHMQGHERTKDRLHAELIAGFTMAICDPERSRKAIIERQDNETPEERITRTGPLGPLSRYEPPYRGLLHEDERPALRSLVKKLLPRGISDEQIDNSVALLAGDTSKALQIFWKNAHMSPGTIESSHGRFTISADSRGFSLVPGSVYEAPPAADPADDQAITRIDVSTRRDDRFHSVEIAGYQINATMSGDGPYVIVKDLQRGGLDRGVALGFAAELWNIDDPYVAAESAQQRGLHAPRGIWLCKYGPGETRAHLGRLSSGEAATVAAEFGISDNTGGDQHDKPVPDFLESPAGRSLTEAVRRRPRFWKKWSDCTSYVGDWYGIALQDGGSRKAA